jgi:predicted ATPase/DNA-binding winged helix-turn-helix (wHTH) protein
LKESVISCDDPIIRFMQSVSEAPSGIAFGRFLLLPQRRELLADGRPVKLGGRAFDVLSALIEARGAVVSKDALMARVWADRIVEENNLQLQISALRAAFGADRHLIRTISGRGYQFTGEIRILPTTPDERTGAEAPAADFREARRGRVLAGELPPTNLPEPVSELIGRDEEVGEILNLAAAHRLVTLTGGGGIGKTRLALALARELLPHFADGVWLADLSPLSDPGLVPATVAAATRLDLGGAEVTMQRVAAALANRRLVLLFDNCEHLIDAAAALAEAVLRAGSEVRIIATSREPLRSEGEWVYTVPPLAVPAEEAEDDEDLARYAAVRLFLERARAAEPRFAPDRQPLAIIAAVCRRLDGIPLAIELAAARAAALGIEELAAGLNDRFRILTGGRRTALPRHRTLRAALDWSYELLSEPERVILRRLAVFAGVFRLEAARAVTASPEITPVEVVDGIANLVAKSLVTVAAGGTVAHYRLLDTTRAYGLEKLAESGERERVARRHAEYYRDLFGRAEAELRTRPWAEWMADYAPKIDNLRTALDWAFSDTGDRSIGVALAAASAELWFALSLWTECQNWAGKALAAIDARDPGTRREMVLQSAFGSSLMFTKGLNEAARAALRRGGQIAENLQDADFQVRVLAALAASCHRLEQFQQALEIGRRAKAITSESNDPVGVSTADWILGTSLMFLGEYREALHYAERTRSLTSAPAVRRAHIVRLGRDAFVAASCTMAIAFWPQGLIDQSAKLAREVLAETATADHPFSLCTALTWCGCIIPLLLGDLETASRSVGRLKQSAERHDLSAFYAYAVGFEGQLCAKRGEFIQAERLLRFCLASLRRSENDNYPAFLSALAEVLAMAGRADEGLAAAEEVVQRTERTRQLWWLPEALRIKGEILLLGQQSEAADDHFRRSLDLAHRQGALSWELRAATSLARLWRDQGRTAEAAALLQPVYDRFTEGFETADLKAAKALLDCLR